MVEIGIYRRRVMEYNPVKREFQVWENDKKILVAPTQLELEDMIEKLPEKPWSEEKGKKDVDN